MMCNHKDTNTKGIFFLQNLQTLLIPTSRVLPVLSGTLCLFRTVSCLKKTNLITDEAFYNKTKLELVYTENCVLFMGCFVLHMLMGLLYLC